MASRDERFRLYSKKQPMCQHSSVLETIAAGWIGTDQKKDCFRPQEFENMINHWDEIMKAMPELETFVPCYDQDDHLNQMGMLSVPPVTPMDGKLVNIWHYLLQKKLIEHFDINSKCYYLNC